MVTTPLEWLSDYQVNNGITNTSFNYESDIIQLSNGNVLITWTSFDDTGAGSPNSSDIIGQIFDPLGNEIGAEFLVNAFRNVDSERSASIAAVDGGGFLVTYVDYAPAGPEYDIFVEYHDNTGAVVRGSILYDGASSEVHADPQVASLSATSSMIVWLDRTNYDVLATVYDPSTGTKGPTLTLFDGGVGAGQGIDGVEIAALRVSNRYAVTFVDHDTGSNNQTYLRIYNSSGNAVTGEILIDDTSPLSRDTHVTELSNGNLVVSWTSADPNFSSGIRAQIYTSSGVAVTEAFSPATSLAGAQEKTAIAATGDNGFVVFWADDETFDVHGQRYSNDGTRIGVEFDVVDWNLSTLDHLSAVALADGRVQLTWTGKFSAGDDVFTAIWDPRDSDETNDPAVAHGYQIGTPEANTIATTADTVQVDGSGGNDRIILSPADAGRADVLDGGAGIDTLVIDALNGTWNFQTAAVQNFEVLEFASTAGALGNRWAFFLDSQFTQFTTVSFDAAPGTSELLAVFMSSSTVFSLHGVAITGQESGDSVVVYGDASDEWIYGSSARDALLGGAGDDTLIGDDGDDTLFGGTGADWLIGSDGNDLLVLNDGSYTSGVTVDLSMNVISGPDNIRDIENVTGTYFVASGDHLTGTDGANLIAGHFGDDTLIGLAGDDTLEGGAQNDLLYGGHDNDILRGEDGDDTLSGQGGNDRLEGGIGSDAIYGGADSDTLIGGAGDDTLSGGGGIDLVDYSGSSDAVEVRLSLTSAQRVSASQGTDTIFGIEGVVGSDHDDSLFGSNGANLIITGDGEDRVFGGGGDDTMDGGAGDNDFLNYYFSADAVAFDLSNQGAGQVVSASQGTDLASNFENVLGSGKGDDTLRGDSAGNVIQGYGGADSIDGAGGDDFLNGGGFDDTLLGGDGNDTVLGDYGDDLLGGGNDDDNLAGGAGDDSVYGGAGSDRINGGTGADLLVGGAQGDVFTYTKTNQSTTASRDIIRDFVSGVDMVDLSGIDADRTTGGNQIFTYIGNAAFTGVAGQLNWLTNGTKTWLQADTNGDAVADFSVQLNNLSALSSADLILNNAPIAQAVSAVAQEDGPAVLITPEVTDPDRNDTFSLSIDTTNTLGAVTITEDGMFSYDPTGAFDFLAIGEVASDTFSYTVDDGRGGTATEDVTITITGQNDAPVARRDIASAVVSPVAVDPASNVTIFGDVSVNDTDADDGSTLTYSLNAPVSGLSMNSDGKFLFNRADPAYARLAKDEAIFIEARYSVTDELGASSQSELNIAIIGSNDAPEASIGSFAAQAISSDVAAQAGPAEIGTVAYSDVDDRASATFSLDESVAGLSIDSLTGKLFFDGGDPAYTSLGAGETLSRRVNYTITDQHGATGTSEIEILVSGANEAPIAVEDTFDVTAGDAGFVEFYPGIVFGSVSANDSDADANDALTFTLVNPVDGLRLGSNGNYAFDARHPAYEGLQQGEIQQIVIPYTMTDNNGGVATADLTLTVTGTNAAPVASAVSDIAVRHPDAAIPGQFVVHERSVAPYVTDIDEGDVLTYALTSPVTGLTMDSDGTYAFDLNDPAFAGYAEGQEIDIQASYTVTDEFGAQDTADLSIRANVTNTRPVVNLSLDERIFQIKEGQVYHGQLVAYDAETPASELRFEFDYYGGYKGTFDLREDGSFTWTPYPYDPGANPFDPDEALDPYANRQTFTYRVYDEQGLGLDPEDYYNGVFDAAVALNRGPNGVQDTSITVSQGSSAEVLRVVLTGSLVDSDGSEDHHVDTSMTAGTLVQVSRTDITDDVTGENNFEYVFDWHIDDTVDLTQLNHIAILTTEAVGAGDDPNDPSDRQNTTSLAFDPGVEIETQSNSFQHTFEAVDQNMWGAGDAMSLEIGTFFGLDSGAFDKTFGFGSGAFRMDVDGQFMFGLAPKLTLTAGEVDASVTKDIDTQAHYNKTFDQFTFRATTQTKSSAFETVSANANFALGYEAIARLDMSAEVDVTVDLLVDEVGFNEEFDLVNFDISSSGNLFTLNTADIPAGEFPLPGIVGEFASITLNIPDISASVSEEFSARETKVVKSGSLEDDIATLEIDLDEMAYTMYSELGGTLPVNPLNPLDEEYGPFSASFDILDIVASTTLGVTQEFDLSHSGTSGWLVMEDGTFFGVDVFEYGNPNSGSSLTIENASAYDEDGNGEIDFQFVASADARLRNQTDLGLSVGIEASVLAGELGISLPVIGDLGVEFGPLLELGAEAPIADLYGFDETFDLAFADTIFNLTV